MLLPKTGRAVRAIADGGPKHHIEKNTFEIIGANQFSQAGKRVLTIGRVDTYRAGAAVELAVVSTFRKNSPVRVVLISPIVKDEAVIRDPVQAMLTAVFHHFAKVVATPHTFVHLS